MADVPPAYGEYKAAIAPLDVPPAYGEHKAAIVPPDMPPTYDEIKFIRDDEKLARTLHDEEIRLAREEKKRVEDELNRERTERMNERRKHEEQERLKDIETYNKLAAERALLRAVYQPSTYERIYNWSLSLLPNYYDYLKKQELSDTLAVLIEKELRANRSEQELKHKIQKLIRESEDVQLEKKTISTRSRPKSKKAKSRNERKPRSRVIKSKKKSKKSKKK